MKSHLPSSQVSLSTMKAEDIERCYPHLAQQVYQWSLRNPQLKAWARAQHKASRPPQDECLPPARPFPPDMLVLWRRYREITEQFYAQERRQWEELVQQFVHQRPPSRTSACRTLPPACESRGQSHGFSATGPVAAKPASRRVNVVVRQPRQVHFEALDSVLPPSAYLKVEPSGRTLKATAVQASPYATDEATQTRAVVDRETSTERSQGTQTRARGEHPGAQDPPKGSLPLLHLLESNAEGAQEYSYLRVVDCPGSTPSRVHIGTTTDSTDERVALPGSPPAQHPPEVPVPPLLPDLVSLDLPMDEEPQGVILQGMAVGGCGVLPGPPSGTPSAVQEFLAARAVDAQVGQVMRAI
eukprot:RCo031197